MKTIKKDNLTVKIYDTRDEMGAAAGLAAAEKIKAFLKTGERVNVIFAAAPSQNEMLATLVAAEGIDWTRVNAFHMDEYIGLDANAPQAFGCFLRDRIFSKLPFGSVNYINAESQDIETECRRYSELLAANPVDIVLLGIGENGHIAFNDPHVADFNDPHTVKAVKLDEICRNQQVHDGCFASIEEVPTHALTITVPALTRAPYLFCIVPAPSKARAVKETLTGRIDEHCPASILRTHDSAILYLDRDSAGEL